MSTFIGMHISEIITLLSVCATSFLTYIVYRLTNLEQKRLEYFKEIVKLYYKMDEARQLMKEANEKEIISYYKSRIKVYGTILLNLIKKYPKPKHDTKELETILLGIIVNPNWDKDFQELSDEFQNFCWTIDMKQKKHYQFTIK